MREADPPPPFVRFSGLKEILASPRLASSGVRLLLMQATSRARPLFGGPLRAKHFHVALALPFLSLPMMPNHVRLSKGWADAKIILW